jgi:RimJ/RimL family protein N-acetyltransferase
MLSGGISVRGLLRMHLERLRQHKFRLADGPLILRPLTEGDWDIIFKWNQDPEVLYYAEGPDAPIRKLEQIQRIYRVISQYAYMFIAELDSRPIGEGWIEQMNVLRISRRYPYWDSWRLDIAIGEKEYWGKGWGTRMIRLLAGLAFEQTRADAVFGTYVADYNERSRRAFEKNGFIPDRKVRQKPGKPVKFFYDMMLTREMWMGKEKGE